MWLKQMLVVLLSLTTRFETSSILNLNMQQNDLQEMFSWQSPKSFGFLCTLINTLSYLFYIAKNIYIMNNADIVSFQLFSWAL